MPPSTHYRRNTRKLTGVAKAIALKQKRRTAAFNAHRRGTMSVAPPPKKLTRKQVQAISMNVDRELRRSARLSTRKAGNTASAAEKRKAATAEKQSVKSAVKSAAATATKKTISLLYPSLLSRGPPGVLKSKIDAAWKTIIAARRKNAGVQEYRRPPPIDATLNALTATLRGTFGNASTRFEGPPRHHLAGPRNYSARGARGARGRSLAVIRENENE
jgi:hypothetical protein